MDKQKKKLWNELLNEYGKTHVATTIELFKKYILLYPKDGAAWIIIGDTYTSIAKYDAALHALRKAEKYVPGEKLDMVYKRYGDAYREKGNYKKAEKLYRKAVEHNPDSTSNHIFLGGLLAHMGRFAEAKKCHKKAAKLKKDTWDEAHYNLGLINRAEGHYETALKHFEKAIAFDASYSAAWKLLGKARTACADKAGALAAYQQGIEIAQKNGDVQALKEMRVFLKRLEKADEHN